MALHQLQNSSEGAIYKNIRGLRDENKYFDVTLVSDDGEFFSAHKIILASQSKKFSQILSQMTMSSTFFQTIYMMGVSSSELADILDFMYVGHVKVSQDRLLKFLKIAQFLSVNSLSDNDSNAEENLPANVSHPETQKSVLQNEEHSNKSGKSMQSECISVPVTSPKMPSLDPKIDDSSIKYSLPDNTEVIPMNKTHSDNSESLDYSVEHGDLSLSSSINNSTSPNKTINNSVLPVRKNIKDDITNLDNVVTQDEIIKLEIENQEGFEFEEILENDVVNEELLPGENRTHQINDSSISYLEQQAEVLSKDLNLLKSLKNVGLGHLQEQVRNKAFKMKRIRKILSTPMAKLPYPLKYMNSIELRIWLTNEIMRDVAMQGKKPPVKISWGNNSCTPSFWPEDLWPWKLIENPCGRQNKKPKGAPMLTRVMRKAIENRFKQLNIDHKTFVDPNYSKDVEIKRMRIRGKGRFGEENLYSHTNILDSLDDLANEPQH